MKTILTFLLSIFIVACFIQCNSNQGEFIMAPPDKVGLDEGILKPIHDSINTWVTLNSPTGVKNLNTYAYNENELFGYFDDCDKSFLGLSFYPADSTIICNISMDAYTRITRKKKRYD